MPNLDNMIRISVILPMYNVEPYLERCIRSLEDQDIPQQDYEIICVNDGSPDNSKQVVLQLQKEYNNIVLIDQKNQGVSRARNNAIDSARGKYLLFVDPDDYVDANSFGRILSNADNHNAEVSFLGFTFLEEDGSVRKTIFNSKHINTVFEGAKAYYVARGDGKTDPDRMWAVLYKSEFINLHKLRFLSNVPYLEDGEFIARILFLAERCVFDGYSFYQRTTRPGSATNSRLFNSERAINGFLLAAKNLKNFKREQESINKDVVFLNRPIVKFVVLCMASSVGLFEPRRVVKTVRLLKENNLKLLSVSGCDKEFRILGRLYNVSPYFLYTYLTLENFMTFGRKSLMSK